MRKRIIAPLQRDTAAPDEDWLTLDDFGDVEITSEDAVHPIESALLPTASGWRAAAPGKQTIRLFFTYPHRLKRIQLKFVESMTARTQQYVLRWSPDNGQSFQEIVRQQWNFSPNAATTEIEDYAAKLRGVRILEVTINPDIGGANAYASLRRLRVA